MDCTLWPTFGRPSRSLIFSQPIVSTGASKSDLILRMFTNCSSQFGGLQTLSATWKKSMWWHDISVALLSVSILKMAMNGQKYEPCKAFGLANSSMLDKCIPDKLAVTFFTYLVLQSISFITHRWKTKFTSYVPQTLGRAAKLSSYSILMCFSFLTLPETGGDRTSATGSSCNAVGSCFTSTGFDDTFSCLILKWRFKYEFLISLLPIFSTKWGQTRFVIEWEMALVES